MAKEALKKKTDEVAALETLNKKLAKAKEKGNKLAIDKIKAKINTIKKGIKEGKSVKDVTAKQLAASLLASRKKFLEMSKKDFNGVIRQLSKKPEYAFLKQYSRDEVVRDIMRKAKPVGWRFKGRGNYKKPTPAQVRKGRANGTVYYENRPNRSDVSQTKQLAKGGKLKDKGLEHFLRDAEKITLANGKVVSKAEFLKMRSKKMAKGGNAKETQLQILKRLIEEEIKDLRVLRKEYSDDNERESVVMVNGMLVSLREVLKDIKDIESGKLYADGGFVPMSMAEMQKMHESTYEPIEDDNYEEDENGIVRYYFEEEPQYAEQGGKIKKAARRGLHKAKETGDDVADWAFNFDPKKRYDNGGEVDINDLDIPVHYTMFEEEMYEYGKGGAISIGDKVQVRKSGKTMEVTGITKNLMGQVEFSGSAGKYLIGDLKKV